MLHPHTELKFISKEIGYGVVATKLIPAGTITWVLDKLDREFSPEEIHSMEPVYQEIMDTYCFRNSCGNFVLCWDLGRFINHSFNANCLSTAYDFEIAIRDIHPGEELTDDYGYLNVKEPFRGIDEGTRRKVVYPNDLERYHKVWDKKIEKVFPKVSKVQQPLRRLIEDNLWEKVTHISSGKIQMDSILCNYYREESLIGSSK